MNYTKKTWKDYPDTTTPILAEDMNNIEDGIEALDTGKVNTSDIVDNLTSTSATVPLSANQGKVLNDLITDKYGIPYSPDISEGKIEIVAGVIKQRAADRTKWDFIDNAGHRPIGVTGTYATASGADITVSFAKTYSKVIGFIVGPDETLASTYNMSIGASVGLGSATFNLGGTIKSAGRIYYDGTAWRHSENTNEAKISSISNAGANITVNHSFFPTSEDLQLCGDTSGGSVVPKIPVAKTSGQTSFAFNFVDYAGSFATSADTSWSCRYSRRYDGKFIVDGTSGWGGLPLENGNIWFYGIFLV